MEFCDLKEQYQRYKSEILAAMEEVLKEAHFIMGPQVKDFEDDLTQFLGVKHAICCSSGTDALLLSLLAYNVQPGDEVIVPDFTFIATAECIALLGAKPVFADIEEKMYGIDPIQIKNKITSRTKGIIPVSLFGQCADFDTINRIAEENGLWVVEDAAQSFGASYKKQKSCTLTDISVTSFFPAKPLGCYGDGGAVFTNNDEYAKRIRMYLNHGQAERYRHSVVGINGRMDTLQAAVLRVKIKHFDDELQSRRSIAAQYSDMLKELKDLIEIPHVEPYNDSTWAQYTVRSKYRDSICKTLKNNNIPTAIHYPLPLHLQDAFSQYRVDDDFPVSNLVSQQVFSLPFHPFLTPDQIKEVTNSIKEALARV
jgi:UDP-2-acetamido-2-deoxy-ribo-hexuluronate aminotransferase